MPYLKFLFCWGLIFTLSADIISIHDSIGFDTMNDGDKEMILKDKKLGLGTELPQKRLHVSGNSLFDSSVFLTGIAQVSDNAVLGDESLVLLDSRGGNIELTLPSPKLLEGRVVYIKKVNSENDVELICPTGTINSLGNVISLSSNSTLPSFMLCSTGSEWVTMMERGEVTVMTHRKTVIDHGSTWSYLDNGTNLDAVSWTDVSYDDSTWSSGPAILGYGTINAGAIATAISYGPDSSDKYPTTYFRQEFNLTGAGNYQNIDLSLLADDSAIVYLNGEEIHRYNLAAGNVGYNDYSTGTGNENSYLETTEISATALQEGLNVIAIEVHQANATSSDVGMDLEMTVY